MKQKKHKRLARIAHYNKLFGPDSKFGSKCLQCGQIGRHFAPPSLGDKGFFMCQKKS